MMEKIEGGIYISRDVAEKLAGLDLGLTMRNNACNCKILKDCQNLDTTATIGQVLNDIQLYRKILAQEDSDMDKHGQKAWSTGNNQTMAEASICQMYPLYTSCKSGSANS